MIRHADRQRFVNLAVIRSWKYETQILAAQALNSAQLGTVVKLKSLSIKLPPDLHHRFKIARTRANPAIATQGSVLDRTPA